jgi:hypothetical protein
MFSIHVSSRYLYVAEQSIENEVRNQRKAAGAWTPDKVVNKVPNLITLKIFAYC